MCVMFDGAMGFLILRSLQCAHTEKRRYRPVGGEAHHLGYKEGIQLETLSSPGEEIGLTLLALGFMLSYTAFVLTFPEKRKHCEGR